MTKLDQAPNRKVLNIGLWICVSWFALTIISSGIAYIVTNLRGTFEVSMGGVEYALITHVLRLVGGLLMVLWLIPLLLGYRRENYGAYLRLSGVLLPKSRAEQITLAVFVIGLTIFMIREFVLFDLVDQLETFHNSPLWFLSFTAFQAAIVEELLLRGAAFGVLRTRYSVLVTMLVTAITFGVMHIFFGPQHTLTSAIIGMMLALLRWRTGTVWGAVAIHFFVNWGTGVAAWMGWLAVMIVTIVFLISELRSSPSPQQSSTQPTT